MLKQILACFALLVAAALPATAANLDNASCLNCHDGKKEKIEVPTKDGDKRKLLPVDHRKLSKSVHGEMQCTDCHKEITDSQANHKLSATEKKPDCIQCHQNIWESVKKEEIGRASCRERVSY